jgi:hypothetical protein
MGGKSGGRATGASTGRAEGIEGVLGGVKGGIFGGASHSELIQIQLAQKDGTRTLQLIDHGGGIGGDKVR